MIQICSVSEASLERLHWERSHWVFLFWNCLSVNVFCCFPSHLLCGLTKYTIVGNAINPKCGYSGNWPCWLSSVFFNPATGAGPLRLGPSTSVVMYLDPLWEIQRQLEPLSDPIPTCTCPQSLQMLKPKLKDSHFIFKSFYTFSHPPSPKFLKSNFNRKDETQLSGGVLGWITLEADSEAKIWVEVLCLGNYPSSHR